MAQTAANPGETYGLGWAHRRAVAAAIAVAVAFGLVMTLMADPNVSTGAGVNAAVSSPGTIALVDDFVTRRYLSNAVPDEDSWKDDHITRRYLPGS